MPLILAPSFDSQTRDQIEDFLSTIRSRRLSAAIEYHQGQSAKLHHESDKVRARVERAYALLGKKMAAVEKADAALAEQLAKCEMLRGELGLILDLISASEGS